MNKKFSFRNLTSSLVFFFSILIISLFIFSCSKKDKVLDGTITSYYANNTIKEIKTYVNGKVEDFKTFDQSGNLEMESINIDSLNSKIMTYYKNGNIKTLTHYKRLNTNVSRKNSEMIGEYILYFENGKKYLEGYREGDTFSQINSWAKDGKQTLINGDGFYIRYDDNGKIIQKEIYKDGKVIKTQ